MLKGISPLISPDLLEVMARMGHGDELVLADAHFPGESIGKRVVRADGLLITDLLGAIMPLFELDTYVPHPVLMMEPVPGDTADPAVEAAYMAEIKREMPDVAACKKAGSFCLLRACRKGICNSDDRRDGKIWQYHSYKGSYANLDKPLLHAAFLYQVSL